MIGPLQTAPGGPLALREATALLARQGKPDALLGPIASLDHQVRRDVRLAHTRRLWVPRQAAHAYDALLEATAV